MSQPVRFDWETIKNEYRVDNYSVRKLSELYGPSEGAIRKRISREGWVKDLSKKVEIETQAELEKRKAEVGDNTPTTDEDIIRESALRNVEKIEQQQQRLQEHSQLVQQYSRILQRVMSGVIYEGDTKVQIKNNAGEVVSEHEIPIWNKGLGAALKDLMDIEKVLIDLERKVHNLNQAQAEDELPILKITKVA